MTHGKLLSRWLFQASGMCDEVIKWRIRMNRRIDKKEVLTRLNIPALYKENISKFRETKPGQGIGLCPFHDDNSPSLSININTGVYHCFSCDVSGGVIDFCMKLWNLSFKETLHRLAERAGIKTTDNSKPVKPRLAASFDYKDILGKKIYWKERWEPGHNGRKKEFYFFHLDENGKKQKGRFIEAVPYNLHLIAKTKEGDIIYFLEGERKVDLLTSWGLIATTLDSGAKSRWRVSYTRFFKEREIIIIPDNDEAGEGYLQTIATALHGAAKTLRVLRLPGLGEREDVLDWFRKGGFTDA